VSINEKAPHKGVTFTLQFARLAARISNGPSKPKLLQPQYSYSVWLRHSTPYISRFKIL